MPRFWTVMGYAALGLGPFGCRPATEPCAVLSVWITPQALTLNAGESATITAAVSTSNCSAAPSISWSSASPGLASVQGSGSQAQVTGLLPTTSAVTVSAIVAGVSGSTQVTVLPLPAIALAPSSLGFSATQGGANPASQSTTITNGGGGTLSGLLVGTISYGPGSTGWLAPPTLSSTTALPSVTLSVQPVITGLVAGNYTATIPVTAGLASNTPQVLSVTLVVAPPPPAIGVAPGILTFAATQGGPDPPAKSSSITNGGGGTLSGLTVGAIGYGPGGSGWLHPPTLSGGTADPSVTLSIQPTIAGLTPGTYSASVEVASAGASNSPQSVTVILTVTEPPPAIALSPATLTFNATQGAGNPPAQATTISNGGGGTLAGLSVGTIGYGPGASGWLQTPTLSGTTANPTVSLSVQPITGSLGPGTYTATVPVQSASALNSPSVLSLTFTVAAAPPSADPCAFANAAPIGVGQTISGALSGPTSCLLSTGQFADLYRLNIVSQTLVAVNLTAGYDDFLQLFDFTSGAFIEEDDDDGPGLNALIVRSLAPGGYILRATSFNQAVTGPYSLSVQTVTAGAPATIEVNGGDAQTAVPNGVVAILPSAVVRDVNGIPVAGALVTFATSPGVGSIAGATAVSDANGVATAGAWTLAAGPNVLSATTFGVGTPAVFSATGRATSAGFTVDLRFVAMPTPAQLQAFAGAVARWQSIITSDLGDIPVLLPPSVCAGGTPSMNETIDDLVIQVNLAPIDGPGSILGSAGPCFIRTAGSLPLLGAMFFDVADLSTMETNGTLGAVILHEMGHVLGIGTLWNLPSFGFLANPSLPSSPGVDTRYTGANGIAGFDLVGGATYTGGGKVPVENLQGGPGTRDSHWRESVLATELMTGFVAPGTSPLSVLTVRSLEDMGYAVNSAAADPFFLLLSLRAGPAQGVQLLNDIFTRPIYRMDGRGRVTDAAGRAVEFRRAKQ